MKTYPTETFELDTLHNGQLVTVILGIDVDYDEYGANEYRYLWAVMYEGTDVLPLLDKQTQNALEMEAEAAASDWFSGVRDFSARSNAFQLGE